MINVGAETKIGMEDIRRVEGSVEARNLVSKLESTG